MYAANYITDPFKDFVNGEETAVTKVYRMLFTELRQQAFKFTNDYHDAEDIVSDIWTKLYDRRAKMQSMEHLRRFGFICTRNACLNFIAKRERYRWLKLTPSRLLDDFNVADDIPVNNEALLQRICQIAEQLPAGRRQIFEMSFFRQIPVMEIAARLGVANKTVYNQRLHALAFIRKNLLAENLWNNYYQA